MNYYKIMGLLHNAVNLHEEGFEPSTHTRMGAFDSFRIS